MNQTAKQLAKECSDNLTHRMDSRGRKHNEKVIQDMLTPLLEERDTYAAALDEMTPGTMGSHCCALAEDTRKRFTEGWVDCAPCKGSGNGTGFHGQCETCGGSGAVPPKLQPQKKKLELPTEKTGE